MKSNIKSKVLLSVVSSLFLFSATTVNATEPITVTSSVINEPIITSFDINTNDTPSVTTTTPEKEIVKTYDFTYDWNSFYNIVPTHVVDGSDLNGLRTPNAIIDIGFDSDAFNREYYAFTNDYGQVYLVLAKNITLQNHDLEPVNENGRYYNDEAKVLGTEHINLDEGHILADSLGGVSNAYNITPQNSYVNRYGEQAEMENFIRNYGSATNFIAYLEYYNPYSQIPSYYHYEFLLGEETYNYSFDNLHIQSTIIEETEVVNDIVNDVVLEETEEQVQETIVSEEELLLSIDTNNNGIVTISEAKNAGYQMPIYSDHWLYKYMIDRNGDGAVGA